MAQPPDFSKLSDQQLDAYLAANGGSQPQAQIQQNPLPDIPGSDTSPYAGMSDEQLNAILANGNPNMGTMDDVGRSVVSKFQQGVSGLLGLPGDIQHLPENALIWAGQKFGGMTPADAENIRVLGRGGLATSDQVNALRQKVTGPDHEPQTAAGRYAGAIAEFAPGALLGPGGPGTKAAMAVMGGGGSALGGDLTRNTPAAPYGSLVGGAMGVGIPAIAHGLISSPQRLLAGAVKGAPPEAIPQALDLMRNAEGAGIRVTFPEAVQQVTNNATGLGRMQRVIEGTKRGGEKLAPFFAERPQQVKTAAMNYADAIAPPTENPSMIGPQAQAAAQGGLDTVRKGINAQAKPFYDALAGESLPPSRELMAVQSDPSFAKALAEIRGNPELNGPIANLPDTDLSVLNEVKKHLNTLSTAARQTELNPSGNNYLASLRGGAGGDLNDLAASNSPEWVAAHAIESQGRRQFLKPLETGPAGKIASTDQVPAQTGALYPKNPLEGASAETVQALRLMNGVDPQVGPALTRQHLVNELNTASRDLAQGPNPYVGSKYANAIAGNPEQATTLRSGVEAVGGDTQRLDNLLEAMRATGKRQPPGSLTAFNAKDLEGLGASVPTTAFRPTDPTTWLKGLSEGVSAIQYHRNVDRLAEVLQMPADEVEKFVAGIQQNRPRGSVIPAATAGRN